MRTLKWNRHEDLAIIRRESIKREAYLDYMTFKSPGPPLFTEPFGPIIGLKEEWEEQGATTAELDFSAFTYRAPIEAGIHVQTGRVGDPPTQILEDTEHHTIYRDGLGRTMKLPKGFATLALPLNFPVRTMDDWLAIKPRYQFTPARLSGDWEARAHESLERGAALSVHIPGGFDEPRQLMGEEAICIAFYDNPELIHDMLTTMGDSAYRVLETVVRRVPVDILNVHEDMAGKSGPLAGPEQIRTFIRPYYRKVWDLLAENGTRLFAQDSDGNMNPVIDAFLDAGLNCMFPMEPGSGMDVVRVRAQYGTRLAFSGGIDKYVLARGHDAIDRELEYKIPPMVRTGGCVIGLDHRIPNGTPLESYRYYIRRAWEIINREWAAR